MILTAVAVLFAIFVMILWVWLSGQVLDPIYGIVLANDAVKAMGFDTGIKLAMKVGLQYCPPLMVFAVIFWQHIRELQRDVAFRRGY